MRNKRCNPTPQLLPYDIASFEFCKDVRRWVLEVVLEGPYYILTTALKSMAAAWPRPGILGAMGLSIGGVSALRDARNKWCFRFWRLIWF